MLILKQEAQCEELRKDVNKLDNSTLCGHIQYPANFNHSQTNIQCVNLEFRQNSVIKHHKYTKFTLCESLRLGSLNLIKVNTPPGDDQGNYMKATLERWQDNTPGAGLSHKQTPQTKHIKQYNSKWYAARCRGGKIRKEVYY